MEPTPISTATAVENVPAAPAPVKRDWKAIVAASNGASVNVPEALIPEVKAWSEKRAEFQKKIAEVAKLENDVDITFRTLISNLRKYLDESGRADAWTSDVGINMYALKDGEFIINITEASPRG